MTVITDGKGGGYSAEVNSENKLRTYSVTESEQLHVNEHDQEVYSIVLDQNPTGAGDCVYYLKNSNDKELVIVSCVLWGSTDTEIFFEVNNTGTPTSPVTLTPVNRNAASNKVADCTSQQGADLALTSGNEVDRVKYLGGTNSYKHRWDSGIILPKNGTFTIWTTADVIINATLTIYFHAND